MKKIIPVVLIFILSISFLFVFSTQAHASFFDDVINGVKNIFVPKVSKELTINSKIELVPGGDLNKNGQIDAGDSVKFSYTISNPTKNIYKSVTLKTNISSKELNGIHNLQGALSLDQGGNTITIPNLEINPNQVRAISFDAQVNYYKDSDQTISTMPELISKQGDSLIKGPDQTVKATKMDLDTFNKFVHITK